MSFGGVSRFFSTFVANPTKYATIAQGLVSLGSVGLTHQYQQLRHKHVIKKCGYLEKPEFKKKDIRYKIDTKHDPKRMTWQDFQSRRWKMVHLNKQFQLWQARLDYGDALCRLKMPSWAVAEISELHPLCVDFLQRKVSGNVKELRLTHYSAYVNHKTGER